MYELEEPVIHQLQEVDLSGTYSYANYLRWLFDERVELIKGKVYEMSPAPSSFHQSILSNLFLPIGNFLKGKPCRIFVAPFDVRFPTKSDDDAAIFTVLQPDICVVCDAAKIDKRGCLGAPDVVIEIISPGNNKKELLHKYKIYEEFGVKEYWVVSQADEHVIIYTLDDEGKYRGSKMFTWTETITSSILVGFSVKADEIFEGI